MAADEGPHVGQTLCATCGHPVRQHFEEGQDQGCVSTRPPDATAEVRVRITAADGACLCPGFVPGRLPYNITKHLDSLVDDEDDCDCVGCRHPLSVHSEQVGCWNCPCNVDFVIEPE